MSPSTYRQLVVEARASYPADKRRSEATTDLPSFFVYRPLSFWMTPPFVAWGISPTAVTLLSLACALAMPLAAVWGGVRGASLVVLLALAGQVLDSVDGNLARMTGRSSPAGAFLDGVASLVFWTAYLVAVGVLARDATSGFLGRHALEIGLGLAVLRLLQRELEDSFTAAFDERVRWGPMAGPDAAGSVVSRFGRVGEHVVAFAGLLLAAAVGALPLFLAAVSVYQLALLVAWIPKFVTAVRRRA